MYLKREEESGNRARGREDLSRCVICSSITLVRLKRRTKRTELFFFSATTALVADIMAFDIQTYLSETKVVSCFSHLVRSYVRVFLVIKFWWYSARRNIKHSREICWNVKSCSTQYGINISNFELVQARDIRAFQYSKVPKLLLPQFVNGANVNSVLFKLVQLGQEQIFFAYFYQIMYCAFK